MVILNQVADLLDAAGSEIQTALGFWLGYDSAGGLN
jgi:hypothetical protein